MLIALLAVLGVDLIVIVVLLASVLARRRWVKRQPDSFRGAIRLSGGEIDDLGPKWRRGYGRWVSDVLVWTKAPFLFRHAFVAASGLNERRPARPDEVKRLGDHPVVIQLRMGAQRSTSPLLTTRANYCWARMRKPSPPSRPRSASEKGDALMTTSIGEHSTRRVTLKVGDADLECFGHGQGVAIVLLPGGGLAVGYLSDLADALAAAGFRAVRINPRGAGGSTARRTVSLCMTSRPTLPA